jgi:hypothetical protein
MATGLTPANAEPIDTELHDVHYIVTKCILLQHAIRIYIRCLLLWDVAWRKPEVL